MSTKIIKCGCEGSFGRKNGAEYQESIYKNGMRAHNSTNTENKYRCTVCQTEHTSGGGNDDEKKKKK